MKRLLLWGVPMLALVLLIGWRYQVQKHAEEGTKAKFGSKSPVVSIAPVGSRDIVEVIQSVGNVVSPFKVAISSKVSGRIQYLTAREGDSVKPGDLLLKVDPSDLQGAVLQQEAALNEARSRLAQAQMTSGATDVGVSSQIRQQEAASLSAKANLEQVERNYEAQVASAQALVRGAENAVSSAKANVAKEVSTLQNAQSHLARTTNLYSKGFLAAQDLDDARTAVEVQKSSVLVAQGQVAAAESQLSVQQQNLVIVKRKGVSDIAASRASLAQAKAGLDVANANRSQSPAYRENVAALSSQVSSMAAQVAQAKARLGETEIRSTIEGTVTARKADPGGLATPGSPVLEIQYMDWLYVSASVPIELGDRVRQGEIAEVTIDALPGKKFSGPIVNINSAADPLNRQFSIDIRLDNKSRMLRPGMFATVKIVTGTIHASVVVPREAVTTDSSGNSTVAVIDGQNVAHVRKVELGAADDRGFEVRTGVRADEKVVVLTFNPLKEGQKVTLGTVDGKGPGQAKSSSGRRKPKP